MDDVYIDSHGGVTTSPSAAMPVLGHTRHTCHECHAEWTLGQPSCSRCRSQAFDSEFVRGTLLERVGDKIRGIAPPAKPVVLPLAADDVAVFERCAAAARAFVAALADADRTAREVVNDSRASGSTVFLQGAVGVAAASGGDFSAANITPMALPVSGLATLIDNMLRQHAEEVTT